MEKNIDTSLNINAISYYSLTSFRQSNLKHYYLGIKQHQVIEGQQI